MEIICINDLAPIPQALKAMCVVCEKLNITAVHYSDNDVPPRMAFTMSEEDATIFRLANGKRLVWKQFLLEIR